MGQIYISKALTASSSNTLGSFSTATVTAYTSGAGATIGTSSGATATTLDTARRIIVWSSAAASDGLRITITGLSESGATISETIVGSSAAGSVKTTTQDFLSITSVSFSSQNTLGAAIHFGTNTQGGTPWKIIDQGTPEPLNFSMALTFNSTISTTLANLEVTLDDPTNTIPAPPRFLSTAPTVQVPFTPVSFIQAFTGSTALSTANAAQTAPAFGTITSNIAAWRLTLTSSSSTAGGLQATAMQYGA